jgi:hypothetical protein
MSAMTTAIAAPVPMILVSGVKASRRQEGQPAPGRFPEAQDTTYAWFQNSGWTTGGSVLVLSAGGSEALVSDLITRS